MANWQRERDIARQEGRKLDRQIVRGARKRRRKDRWQTGRERNIARQEDRKLDRPDRQRS